MKWAVGVMSYHDNELVVEVVEAATVKDAVLAHSFFDCGEEFREWAEEMPLDIEGIAQYCFDGDIAVGVTGVN